MDMLRRLINCRVIIIIKIKRRWPALKCYNISFILLGLHTKISLNVLVARNLKEAMGKLSKNFAVLGSRIGNKQLSEIIGDTNLIPAVKCEGLTLTTHPQIWPRTHTQLWLRFCRRWFSRACCSFASELCGAQTWCVEREQWSLFCWAVSVTGSLLQTTWAR